ncbi:hypothetical protein NA57DRAFT_74838 [Rhizodiscina lignyota]|uniref:MFS general substrate transporter n=1 Tax=Rhizodiscina lignyota TaxID=1504668 RepID=A0A9P4IGR4_9PEZI|nr:hypothetical protein NA57DRAFT_74838 [Rhizodiscina lignyota]
MGFNWKTNFRWHSPFLQTCLCSLCLGLTAGIYVALSSLGAGGGRAESQHMIDIAQSCLDGAAVLTGLFTGVLLNKMGPAFCTAVGALGYPFYVGGYWYFGENGRLAFPIAGATILGLTCTLIEGSVGYVAMCYAEERHKGMYVGIMQVVLYCCSFIASSIPLGIDAGNPDADSVPTAVYGTFVALMACAVVMGSFVLPPEKVQRDDGTTIAKIPDMTFKEAIIGAAKCFADWRLILLVPAMMSTEIHLVYLGVVNGWHNNSRARALNGFIALLISIPVNVFLSWLLDNKRWNRKARGYAGTIFVGIFLISSFIAEVVRVRDWDRNATPLSEDWNNSSFGGELILFIIAWNSSGLVLNLVTWYLGAMSNDPVICAHYSGLSRCLLGVGQGMMFGIDASGVAFVGEAGAMLALFTSSIIGLLLFTYYCMEETRYFKEDHVIVPIYAREHRAGSIVDPEAAPSENEKVPASKEANASETAISDSI